MAYEKDRYFSEDVDDFASGLTLLILGVVGHGHFRGEESAKEFRVFIGVVFDSPCVCLRNLNALNAAAPLQPHHFRVSAIRLGCLP